MDYASLPLFSLMKAKLNYASERQSVLAQNIANADTPDYRAKDVTEPDFKAMVSTAGQSLPMAMTKKNHISANAAGGAHFKTDERKSTYEQSPVGNNVVVEEEMMRVAQNQAEYQKVLNLYRKTVSMFKIAVGANPNT